jgi:hypothetical protein
MSSNPLTFPGFHLKSMRMKRHKITPDIDLHQSDIHLTGGVLILIEPFGSIFLLIVLLSDNTRTI